MVLICRSVVCRLSSSVVCRLSSVRTITPERLRISWWKFYWIFLGWRPRLSSEMGTRGQRSSELFKIFDFFEGQWRRSECRVQAFTPYNTLWEISKILAHCCFLTPFTSFTKIGKNLQKITKFAKISLGYFQYFSTCVLATVYSVSNH